MPDDLTLLNLSPDAIVVTGPDGVIEFWNPSAEEMFGYHPEYAIGRQCQDLLSPSRPADFASLKRELAKRGRWEGEIAMSHRDGTRVQVFSRWTAERNEKGEPLRLLFSGIDAAFCRRHLVVLSRGEEQNFDSMFSQHPDGVFAFSRDRRLVFANQALSRLTGYSREELLSMSLMKLVPAEQSVLMRKSFYEALRGRLQTSEVTCVRKDGSTIDASITLLPNFFNNRVVGLHGILKDISHTKRDERHILYLANHDALTGLPNRNLLNDRMEHAIQQAKWLDTQIAVLFMDLNRFKIINDSLGHDKGDVLLRAVSERLKTAVRDVDTVARLGGDEFVVMLENITDTDYVLQVAKELLRVVCQPVNLDGNIVSVSTSIGASLYPSDGESASTLLKNADLAMYAAKDFGLGQFRLYSPDMNLKAVTRLMRENNLRHALAQSQLTLHYQPRIDITLNEIVGVEALVRWDHPEKGLIYPANFIELAEETGMIDEIGEWVLMEACQQLKVWRDNGLRPIKMSVNVSAVQLKSDRICETVVRALELSDVDPAYLDLEITESSLMENLDTANSTLQRFRAVGVSLSIDDFGTGYSSLNYLKRLPINTLKIDKSFVRDVADNQDDAAIISATIAMAHNMHLRVVAEGVTSFEQMEFLRSCRCDEVQGYLICQPLPPDEMESFFKTSQLRGINTPWPL
jgi:diguanylate cyclase (GGDEF)-like protein/PAS domain S-box-containing protein